MSPKRKSSVINKVIINTKKERLNDGDELATRRSIFDFQLNQEEDVATLPPITIVRNLLMIGCNQDEVQAILGIGKTKLGRLLKAYGYKNFSDAKNRHFGRIAPFLRAKAVEMAMDGDSNMLKFLLKNLTDWTENPDNTARTVNHNIVLDSSGDSIKSVNSDKTIEEIIAGDIEEDDV